MISHGFSANDANAGKRQAGGVMGGIRWLLKKLAGWEIFFFFFFFLCTILRDNFIALMSETNFQSFKGCLFTHRLIFIIKKYTARADGTRRLPGMRAPRQR
jgi:hypothetical protein